MRSYIFTEKEREMLERWLETGETDQRLKKLFSSMGRNTPLLRRDLEPLFQLLRR